MRRGTGLIVALSLALVLALALGLALGEVSLSAEQWRAAFTDPASPAAEIVWSIRAPRTLAAALVGASLGLAGAAMQGLLRNPLADPAVLGVSSGAALFASMAIAAGVAGATPLAIETAALLGALLAGAAIVALAARFPEPETLILVGVALSALGAAASALVFNLSPSPVTSAEVLSWLLGSVEGRDFADLGWAIVPAAAGAALAFGAGRGLAMLTLGEEAAAVSGLPMAALRAAAVAGAALLTGASVALAGVVGFVGLASPHLVRRFVADDPAAVLFPSALAGAALVELADIVCRLVPTEVELKLGVVTAILGAPLLAGIAWRAQRSWRR